MDNIKIKSYRMEYEVKFVQDFSEIANFIDDKIIIIDSNVLDIYKEFNNHERTIVIEAKESNKDFLYCYEIIQKILDLDFKRGQVLCAIGGGIVQDIVGFVSSILFRGVDWVFVPTTLLSQTDSCIGSKTSINVKNVKNLLGSFYPPNKILSYTGFLESLNNKEIKSGIGEIYHYLVPNDLEAATEMSNLKYLNNKKLLMPFIKKSLSIKKEMIEIDEFDRRERIVFNYGHTFGHAIESMTKNEINHGMAVTLGMDIANYFSMQMGFIEKIDYNILKNILKDNFPKVKITNEFVDILMKDKKNKNINKLTCILLKNKKEDFLSFPIEIDKEMVVKILQSYCDSKYCEFEQT